MSNSVVRNVERPYNGGKSKAIETKSFKFLLFSHVKRIKAKTYAHLKVLFN